MAEIITDPKTFCEKHHACSDGAVFASKYQTMAEVWDNCERGDWMLWICDKHKVTYDRRKLAAKFVREIWHLLKDDRSKAAIEAIENDCLTDEIKQAAYAAYNAAYNAAYAAAAAYTADAAADAAYAYAAAAYAYAAAYDAAAADAAADAAAADAADAAAAAYADASRAIMRKRQADIVRSSVPNPFK